MDINLERYHKSFEIGSNKETLLKMLYMPKRQFGLFTVNIDSMFRSNQIFKIIKEKIENHIITKLDLIKK